MKRVWLSAEILPVQSGMYLLSMLQVVHAKVYRLSGFMHTFDDLRTQRGVMRGQIQYEQNILHDEKNLLFVLLRLLLEQTPYLDLQTKKNFSALTTKV